MNSNNVQSNSKELDAVVMMLHSANNNYKIAEVLNARESQGEFRILFVLFMGGANNLNSKLEARRCSKTILSV